MKRLRRKLLITAVAGFAVVIWPVHGLAQVWSQVERERRIARNESFGFKNVIRGRLTDVNGRPLSGVRVIARFTMHQTGASGEGDAVSNADGRYEIRGLSSDRFTVFLDTLKEGFLPPKPAPADLRAAHAATRDFTLEQGPWITVRVVDAETGQPVSGLEVRAGQYGVSSPPIGATGRDGTFSWRADSLELSVQVGPLGSSATEKLGPAPGYSFFHQMRLPRSQPYVWTVKTYQNPEAQKSVAFHGTVVDEAGLPVPDAEVRLFQYGERTVRRTDSEGRFSLPARRIMHEFDGKPTIVLTVDRGDLSATIQPHAEETWGDLRIVAQRAHSAGVTGLVVDDKGHPFGGCAINPIEFFGNEGAQPSVGSTGTLWTDDDGRFRLTNLRPEAFYAFSFGGWSSRSRAGNTAVPAEGSKERSVRLRPGELRDLGRIVVPRADGTFTGQVREASGMSFKGKISAVVEGKHTRSYPELAADGSFTADHLVPEPLTLRIFASKDGFTRSGADSPDLLLERSVKVGDRNLRFEFKWRPPKP